MAICISLGESLRQAAAEINSYHQQFGFPRVLTHHEDGAITRRMQHEGNYKDYGNWVGSVVIYALLFFHGLIYLFDQTGMRRTYYAEWGSQQQQSGKGQDNARTNLLESILVEMEKNHCGQRTQQAWFLMACYAHRFSHWDWDHSVFLCKALEDTRTDICTEEFGLAFQQMNDFKKASQLLKVIAFVRENKYVPEYGKICELTKCSQKNARNFWWAANKFANTHIYRNPRPTDSHTGNEVQASCVSQEINVSSKNRSSIWDVSRPFSCANMLFKIPGRLFKARFTYEGNEPEGGYLVCKKGDIIVLRSQRSTPGDELNSYGSYAYGNKEGKDRFGGCWLPVALLWGLDSALSQRLVAAKDIEIPDNQKFPALFTYNGKEMSSSGESPGPVYLACKKNDIIILDFCQTPTPGHECNKYLLYVYARNQEKTGWLPVDVLWGLESAISQGWDSSKILDTQKFPLP